MPISAPNATRSHRSASRGSGRCVAGQRRRLRAGSRCRTSASPWSPRPGASYSSGTTAPRRAMRVVRHAVPARRAATQLGRGVSAVDLVAPVGPETASCTVIDRPLAADVELAARSRTITAAAEHRRAPRPGSGSRVSVAHRVVVAVRLVGLERGELRVVGGVGALVAEVAAQLEDPLDRRRRRAASGTARARSAGRGSCRRR